MKCFIIERYNRTVSCVQTGKLLPKLSTVAILGWALMAMAAEGINELTTASQIFQNNTHSCDSLTFCSVRVCSLQASVPLPLSEMAPAAFLSPWSFPSHMPCSMCSQCHASPSCYLCLFTTLLLALTSTAAGTKRASLAEQVQLDSMPCPQL